MDLIALTLALFAGAAQEDPDYAPVPAERYHAMQVALQSAPAEEGRFAGTPEQQAALVAQMRALFDDPVEGETVSLKRGDTLGLADDLEQEQHAWSLGQYSQALATLLEEDSE